MILMCSKCNARKRIKKLKKERTKIKMEKNEIQNK